MNKVIKLNDADETIIDINKVCGVWKKNERDIYYDGSGRIVSSGVKDKACVSFIFMMDNKEMIVVYYLDKDKLDEDYNRVLNFMLV